MKSYSSIICVGLILFISINSIQAHGGNCACSAFGSIGVGGPIITIPAYTATKGTTSVSFGFGFFNSGRLSPEQINIVRSRGEHSHDLYGSLVPTAAISHAWTDKFSTVVSMPYRINLDFRDVEDHGSEAVVDAGNSIGFGDMNILSEYQVLNLKKHKVQAALLAGIKLPTGQTNVKSNEGEQFEIINQPGSGSFDPILGAAFSKQIKNFGFDFNFIYRIVTTGDHNTDVGDIMTYNFATTYAVRHNHDEPFHHAHDHSNDLEKHRTPILERILPQHLWGQHLAWDLILEGTVIDEAQPETNNIKVPNHGGTMFLISPGFRVTINDKLVYNFNIGFPVVEDLIGQQGGTDLRVFMGLATTL